MGQTGAKRTDVILLNLYINHFGKKRNMAAKKKKNCLDETAHVGHICELESQEEWDTIRMITDRPAVRCENCGNQANAATYVCMPEDL